VFWLAAIAHGDEHGIDADPQLGSLHQHLLKLILELEPSNFADVLDSLRSAVIEDV
jgi:hypothetical protein